MNNTLDFRSDGPGAVDNNIYVPSIPTCFVANLRHQIYFLQHKQMSSVESRILRIYAKNVIKDWHSWCQSQQVNQITMSSKLQNMAMWERCMQTMNNTLDFRIDSPGAFEHNIYVPSIPTCFIANIRYQIHFAAQVNVYWRASYLIGVHCTKNKQDRRQWRQEVDSLYVFL